jgi:hypothetical protein
MALSGAFTTTSVIQLSASGQSLTPNFHSLSEETLPHTRTTQINLMRQLKTTTLFSEILIQLVSVNPTLEMISQLLRTCRLFYHTLLSSEMIWIIMANTMSCSYCFYQMKRASSLSSLSESLYWYEAVKGLDAQRKIRRQWGLIFASQVRQIASFLSIFTLASQVLLNSGKKTVVHRPASAGPSKDHSASLNPSRRIHSSDQKKRPLAYSGSQLVHILDAFLLSEARTLLSASNVLRHWHDLTAFPNKLRAELITKDHLCSPPLSYGNPIDPNVSLS